MYKNNMTTTFKGDKELMERVNELKQAPVFFSSECNVATFTHTKIQESMASELRGIVAFYLFHIMLRPQNLEEETNP